MTRRILIPLDGSATAEAVLPYVAPLARAADDALLLLRVVTPGEISESLFWKTTIPVELRREWTEAVLSRANIYLAGVTERSRMLGLRAAFDVQAAEEAAAAIIARAEQDASIGLIAMTTHGYGGALRWAFGSVASKVLHGAPTPLLVIRTNGHTHPPAQQVTYRKLCVALDGSTLAEQALPEAELLAASVAAELVLLSIVTQPGDNAVEAETYLKRVAARLHAGKLTIRTHVAEGQPAEQIIRVAAEEQADLIVMATHGRAGMQQLWLGSVATKVVHGTPLPVLLVRARISS